MNDINARLLTAAMRGDEVGLKAILREPGGGALTKTNDMQNALAWAAEGGHGSCIRLLLPVSDTWGKDEDGITPLMHAARYGHDACLELLLPVSDALAKCKYGMTALMYAACDGSEACVRVLLSKSDALAKDKDGRTANFWAKKEGHESLARFLEAYELSRAEQASVEESVSASANASRKQGSPRV